MAQIPLPFVQDNRREFLPRSGSAGSPVSQPLFFAPFSPALQTPPPPPHGSSGSARTANTGVYGFCRSKLIHCVLCRLRQNNNCSDRSAFVHANTGRARERQAVCPHLSVLFPKDCPVAVDDLCMLIFCPEFCLGRLPCTGRRCKKDRPAVPYDIGRMEDQSSLVQKNPGKVDLIPDISDICRVV